ncbi:MAG: hypothetical protein A2Y38_17005 [Spirochaetes bacterium GWB1_59_5]|nr:MAG: hypothetical protein A2Y38_17005 [Spirochaetes bacterium GWB1_59_5]
MRENEKRCTRCKQWKGFELFHKSAVHPSGRASACIECLRKVDDVVYEKKLEQKFGLSVQDYQALLIAQSGRCAICLRPERATKFGKVVRLSVDHCHTTGRVRGLLCRSCNFGLGSFDDDPDTLLLAANYLDEHNRTASLLRVG